MNADESSAPRRAANAPAAEDADWRKAEWLKCAYSPGYWIHTYLQIYDATNREWIPFRLWRAQFDTLKTLQANRLVIILKARQLGMTWLVLAYALWLMLFQPIATVLLFSKRDDEATYLLGVERMKGMYARLPEWMKARRVEVDNDHEWMLSNGSVARAFPTSAGDSYTATLAVVDEADLVPDLNRLMNAVKPTIDGGGRMILLSRVDKTRPLSEFKRIYRAAVEKINNWAPVFLPWHVRPGRTPEWYDEQKRDIVSRTGSTDDLYQQYPATDTEALLPATANKRIAGAWLEQQYEPSQGFDQDERGCLLHPPAIPGLVIYAPPLPGRKYVLGTDPAEGNPTSDDSALTVLDVESGAEVAKLAGKFEPSTLAAHAAVIARYFNSAGIMVERNNHGHAVLLWLRDHAHDVRRLPGWDGKEGWLSNSKGKNLLYDATADAFREGDTRLHTFETYVQLASIEGSTLLAPEGEHDDLADSYALALVGRMRRYAGAAPNIR